MLKLATLLNAYWKENQREKYQHENKKKMGVFQEMRVAASFRVLSFYNLLWYVLKVTLVLSCVLQ
jgi:hypothetical protein